MPIAAAAPLAGIRALDLGQVWAGPQLGCYLADFGADVIVIETGTRNAMQASSLRLSGATPAGAMQPYTEVGDPRAYNGLGRNRRYATVNLEHPEGHALFLRLAAVSDVVFDNFAPRAVQKLGIGYETLARVNPGIIVASLSAAGQQGPWSDLVTYGPSLTALYGSKSLLGYPGETNVQEDVADFDPTAATYAMFAILAALRWRNRTGRGQFIDVAQGEAGLTALAEAVTEYTLNGKVMGPNGNRHRAMAPHGIYPAKGDDRWIAISVEDETTWQSFCTVVDQAAAAADPRFRDVQQRLRNVEALDQAVAGWTRGFEVEPLTARLQAAGVAAYPVLDAPGVLGDDQLHHRRRERFSVEPAGVHSEEILSGNPWLLSKSRPVVRTQVKLAGGDNQSVFGDTLGLSAAELAAAVNAGAIA